MAPPYGSPSTSARSPARSTSRIVRPAIAVRTQVPASARPRRPPEPGHGPERGHPGDQRPELARRHDLEVAIKPGSISAVPTDADAHDGTAPRPVGPDVDPQVLSCNTETRRHARGGDGGPQAGQRRILRVSQQAHGKTARADDEGAGCWTVRIDDRHQGLRDREPARPTHRRCVANHRPTSRFVQDLAAVEGPKVAACGTHTRPDDTLGARPEEERERRQQLVMDDHADISTPGDELGMRRGEERRQVWSSVRNR